jgi:hypothetical protein
MSFSYEWTYIGTHYYLSVRQHSSVKNGKITKQLIGTIDQTDCDVWAPLEQQRVLKTKQKQEVVKQN